MELSRALQKKEVVTIMTPEEAGDYIGQRREKLTGAYVSNLGRAMGIPPQNAVDIIAGRRPLRKRNIARFNALDPEYELIQLIGVIKRSPENGPSK